MATPEDSSLIRCSICFNSKQGRQPRALQCVRSFCNECLKEWHEKRYREGHSAKTQVECPTCRSVSTLPSGDISGLPIDINVQQFTDYINKESKLSCHVCKIKRGKSTCMMCFVFLCEDCGEEHIRSPLFASHVLSKNICELHGAALQSVCTTCLCGVCLQCIHEDLHKDHSLDDISSGIKKIRSKVKKCTEDIEKLLKRGNSEINEKRKYIKQFKSTEDMKRSLDLIKKEVHRLEEEIAEHESLCGATIETLFKEYEAHSKLASAAILNGKKLLEEDEAGVLGRIKSAHVPNDELCGLLETSLNFIPNFNYIALSKCRLYDIEKALEFIKNCKVVCSLSNVSLTQAPPVEVLKIECGDGCDIENPWRLSGTPEGDVIVSNLSGGPIYKIFKDGTKTRLQCDGIAACVHAGDIYVLSADGSLVTRIKQDKSTVNHKIKYPIANPKGLAIYDGNAFILSRETVTKQPLDYSNSSNTFNIRGCKHFSHLLNISHGGMRKLVITDRVADEVIICNEDGAVLTRFSGYSGADYDSPCNQKGISRMSNGHLLVADWANNRIAEYELDGTFVGNLLTTRDGLQNPSDISYKYPYLWIVQNAFRNKYIKLFKYGGQL